MNVTRNILCQVFLHVNDITDIFLYRVIIHLNIVRLRYGSILHMCLLTCDLYLCLGYCCSYSGTGRSETESEICTFAGAHSAVW